MTNTQEFILTSFLAFTASTLIALFLTPIALKAGWKLGVTDQPESRKEHINPIVRSGGLAMVFSFLISTIAIYSFKDFLYLSYNNTIVNTIIISGLLIFLVGLTDDFFGLSPWPRLVFQIIIASYAWANGININSIDISWINGINQDISIPIYLSYFISILWLVGSTNAINWIDGLDGLAAGIVGISSFGAAVLSFYFGQLWPSIMSSALAGSCLGFLRYNFYPSKIIMGDGGSYFLGFVLSSLTLVGLGYENQSLYLHLSILILFIPLFDMSRVIFIRLIKGNSPFYPDRSHFHYALKKIGLSHQMSVITIYYLDIIVVCLAFYFANITVGLYLFLLSTIFILCKFNWIKSK